MHYNKLIKLIIFLGAILLSGCEDCCDADGGLCCSTGSSAALLASAWDKDTLRAIAPQSHALLAIHLFLPRANGPPPTPPPIA